MFGIHPTFHLASYYMSSRRCPPQQGYQRSLYLHRQHGEEWAVLSGGVGGNEEGKPLVSVAGEARGELSTGMGQAPSLEGAYQLSSTGPAFLGLILLVPMPV